ncbi:hypothetical protein ITP53_11400 [Nonomuraea sp. K274]|uniref:Uncharacterized protein n=1 Tax=Nonomuraea cypriaca TaxID=1187855 RepID=A0A931AA73_9ACTN|nr:hypothetical protein [Nonomuraea cypriaca]MBF8186344.1 hypothetical protein [Nonomuraea cypriaca]
MAALRGMPMLYAALSDLLVAPRSPAVRDDVRVAVSKSPPVPLDLHADELAREMVEIVVSWEERVRDVARLVPLDTAASRARRQGVALSQAVRVLAPRIDALLALPAATMARGGELLDLDGAAAGLEILDMRRRASRALPESRGDSRPISIPCGGCGWRTLMELLDALGYLDGARCRNCGHEYDAEGLATRRADALAQAQRRAGAQRGAHA